MSAPTAIDVCIATFKRPELLGQLLRSLHAQDLEGLAPRIIVIDNDQAQSARAVVEALRGELGLDIVYDTEPQQNISLARNRAMSHVQAEYFAFVDDDETVSPRWLRSLLACMHEHRADIVFSPVYSVLPAHAPAWAAACFKRPVRASGTVLQTGGAGSVLIKRARVIGGGARFDPAFGLTGGEDTDFFYRAHLAGCRLVWCQEATASEPVPDARLTVEWVQRRGFRGGQSYAVVFVSRFSWPRKVAWFAVRTGQLLARLALAPVLRLLSYPDYVALSVKLAVSAGELSYCFSGKRFEEYRGALHNKTPS